MGRPKGTTKKQRAEQTKAKNARKAAQKKEKVEAVEPVETEKEIVEAVKPVEAEKENIMAKKQNIEEDIPLDNFNPLSEPVVEREYTQDMIKADMGGEVVNSGDLEESIPEPTYDNPFFEGEDDIPSQPSSGGSSVSQPKESSASSFSSEPQRPPINPALDDLDAKSKRKAAKKTAEALLSTYARVFPYPFKKISSFNMNKMERLDMAGEIDLKMPVTEDGKTVQQHMDAVNQQVEDVFQVTEEMQEELREPLVDLLMEQELALTPTQRLLIVFGGQAVQFTTATIQIALSNKQALAQFKEFRAEQGHTRPSPSPSSPPPPPPPSQPTQNAPQDEYEAPTVEEDDEYEAPEIVMSDYMNDNISREDEDIASVENGGITVEEEPQEQVA